MNCLESRRSFMKRVASCAAATAWPAAGRFTLSAADPKDQDLNSPSSLPIVDTHQHLWDLSKFSLPWAKGHTTLDRSFVTADYLAATAGVNLVQSVYMEVDVAPAQQAAEADYVLDLCRRNDNPMSGAVISGRPASSEFAASIARYKGNPLIKGVRQVLHSDATPPGFCLDKQFVASVHLLGEMGMSFDLCMRPGELRDGEKLAALCPRTRFIVDHCGNMSVQETDAKKIAAWKQGMQALAQRDNVVCKISGIVVTAREDWQPADLEPNMRFSMETFGPDRSMFAGDWPVCTQRATFAQWVAALEWITRDLPLAYRRKLFHDNAVRFYGLQPKPWKRPAS